MAGVETEGLIGVDKVEERALGGGGRPSNYKEPRIIRKQFPQLSAACPELGAGWTGVRCVPGHRSAPPLTASARGLKSLVIGVGVRQPEPTWN